MRRDVLGVGHQRNTVRLISEESSNDADVVAQLTSTYWAVFWSVLDRTMAKCAACRCWCCCGQAPSSNSWRRAWQRRRSRGSGPPPSGSRWPRCAMRARRPACRRSRNTPTPGPRRDGWRRSWSLTSSPTRLASALMRDGEAHQTSAPTKTATKSVSVLPTSVAATAPMLLRAQLLGHGQRLRASKRTRLLTAASSASRPLVPFCSSCWISTSVS